METPSSDGPQSDASAASDAGREGPKNIVLFSDGTGNSASKAAKTNVWRTYQALDLRNGGPVQVAYYRDGVGTETFKPLALLASAFGFGVMREVRELYVFLCRNYREGDKIYAFGFSRGAFTIRLLVGMVALFGLVRADSENQLYRHSCKALRAFRRHFLKRAAEHGSLAFKAYSLLLPPPPYVAGSGETRIDLGLTTWPAPLDIEFLGLWDTVDAYGMPIEELKQGIDRWVWPLSFADRKLSPIVRHACHALSLDDERPSFRPMLWDESDARDKVRIEQVWFAGVHANVGGGYPIDDLSFVPLVWMLEKARRAGLRFFDDQIRFFEEMQNIHGTAYDSRAGVAGYFRYGPRSLEKLCNDKRNGVIVNPPVIHDSVGERIARRHRCYAPISVARDVSVTDPGTGVSASQDPDFVDFAWDIVLWRRITYFATVALSGALVCSPLYMGPDRSNSTLVDTFSKILPPGLGWLVDKLLGLAPTWAAAWVEVFKLHYLIVFFILVVIWLLWTLSDRLQRYISERSEFAWAKLKGIEDLDKPKPQLTDRFIRVVRMSPLANTIGTFYDQRLIPNVAGVTIWFAIFYAGYRLVDWAATWLSGAA